MCDTINGLITHKEFELPDTRNNIPSNIATIKFSQSIIFRQYGGLFSKVGKELALRRITNSLLHQVAPVQSMGNPVVVPIASKEELFQFASKEESSLLFASQEESKQFA